MKLSELHRLKAYSELGITEEAVASGIQITPQLKAIAAVIRRAGQPKVQKTEHTPPYGPGSDVAKSWPWYLATSDSPDSKKVLDIYYAHLKVHRRLLPVEAFCLAANVSPLRVLELITGCCVRLGAQASTIIAAVNHPRIVEKAVEMALTDAGHDDRKDLHQAVGFLPTAKGTNIHISQIANAQSSSASTPAPPPEQTIRRMVIRFNDAKQLPADTGNVRMPEVMSHSEAELVEVESEAEEEEEAELTP